MGKKNFILFLILNFNLSLLFTLVSCSGGALKGKEEIKNEVSRFNFTDPSGNYQVLKEVGIMGDKKEVFVKTQLLPESGDEEKPLEKNIAISNFGYLKTKAGKIKILNPKISQYTVWLDGQKFFSQMKTNFAARKVEIFLVSPEKKWQGKSYVTLPPGDNVYCFYSQLVECIKVTEFLKLSTLKKAGKMTFKLIWDNFPYLQEHYANIPPEVYSDAVFAYDGETNEGIIRYTLKVGGQSIFYHFDKKNAFLKKFWVSQGISQIKL